MPQQSQSVLHTKLAFCINKNIWLNTLKQNREDHSMEQYTDLVDVLW